MGGGEIRVVFKNESDNTREELMAVRPQVEEGEDGRYLNGQGGDGYDEASHQGHIAK